ncbi:MAG: lysozyme inhibitor LprI family protein [Clostridium sp.]|uniref:lysozyme inhibitor LprI family protein n=1 Tax=Clostridium sp. TaxID=1506 RepID=UPI00290F5213|nr:lysozyme inhibitor LprI family protein [Clostridium sp.]MDU5110962.1 lysozyme inhibitor LprI family protein [Clostridium sp.]
MSKITKSIICIVSVSSVFLVGCSNVFNDIKEQSNNEDKIITSVENTDNNETDIDKGQDAIESKENDSTNDNEKITIKQMYLDKLNELEADLNTSLKEKYDSGITLKMIEAASEEYEKWDKMLNEVYSKLAEQLSETEINNLTEDELNWIKIRDEKSDAADDKFEGGSIAPFLRIDSLAKTTKERCYELVNNYMK